MADVPGVILEHVYAAAADETEWASALREIATWVGASGAMYCLLDNSEIRPQVKALYSSGFAQSARASYAEADYLVDPHMSLGMRTPLAQWFFSQDHFDEGFIARNAFFHEVMNPLGVRWVAGSRIWEADRNVACLAFQKPVDAPAFSELDRERLNAATAHVGRATRIHDRLTSKSFEAGLGVEAMNNLTLGVALLDSSARAVYSNAAAERLFAQDKTFRSLPGGRIALAHADCEKTFRRAIAEAMKLKSAALHIVDCEGKPVINSVILPLPPSARLNSHWQRPLAMFTLSEIRSARTVPTHFLHQLFALTPAESGLANWLLTGRPINDYADARRISVATVRTQLKAVLAKTGMRRQAELVARLANLPTA